MKLLSTIGFFETPALGDIEEREILERELDVRLEDDDFLQLLEMTGRYKESKNKEYFSYANDFLYNTAVINTAGGAISQAAGSEGTVTFTSTANIEEDSIMMNPADGKLAYIRSVDSATACTVYFIDAWSLAITNTFNVSFPTKGIEEGGSTGDKKTYTMTQLKNYLQTYETADTVSDLMLAGYTVLKMADGSKNYAYKLESEIYRKHRMDIANSFIVGKRAKFARTDGGSSNVQLTRGLNDYVMSEGGVSSTTGGALSKANFRTFSRALDAARSPKSGFLWCGGEMNADIDDLFDTILDQGAIDYSVFGKGNGKQKAIDLGVNTFTVYGRTFYKSMVGALDHPKVTNVNSGNGDLYANVGYYVPTDKIKGVDGTPVDRVCGRHMKFPKGINGRWHVKYTGGLAPVPNGDDNKLRISVTSWEGFEVVGTSQLGRLQITS